MEVMKAKRYQMDFENGGLKEVEHSNNLEIGHIIFLDGYEKFKGSAGNENIVFKIENGNFGKIYHTVEKTTLELKQHDTVKPYAERFGIGLYFEPSEKFQGSDEELKQLVNKAVIKANQEAQAKEERQRKAEEERQRLIEEGKKLLKLPKGAKSVIVASYIKDESDYMTDYYAESTQKEIVLGFSTHTRDIFSEMRKACLNSDAEEIKAFAVAPEVNCNGKTFEEYAEYMKDYYNEKEARKHWHPEDEQREKYSMGKGYYLQKASTRSGVRIQKDKYSYLKDGEPTENLYIAVAKGRFCAKVKPTTQEHEKIEVEGLKLIDYSEKAFAMIGDTKPVKEQIKALGGRFNKRLSCGAGWIFPKTKLQDVQTVFNIQL